MLGRTCRVDRHMTYKEVRTTSETLERSSCSWYVLPPIPPQSAPNARIFADVSGKAHLVNEKKDIMGWLFHIVQTLGKVHSLPPIGLHTFCDMSSSLIAFSLGGS
jgi:hypothetical protein